MPTVADDSVAGGDVAGLVKVLRPVGAPVVSVPDGGGDVSVVLGSGDEVVELPVGVELGVPADPVVSVGVGLVVVLGDVFGVRVGVAVGNVGLTAGRGSGACGRSSTRSCGSRRKPRPIPATAKAEPTALCATRTRRLARTPDRRRVRCRGSKGVVSWVSRIIRASSRSKWSINSPYPTGSMTSPRIRRSRATPRDAWDLAVPTGHPSTSATCLSGRSW